MGVRLRSAVSPVTPAIIGSRRPRHRIGLKAPPVRFQPAATSTPAPVGCGWHRGAIFMGCAQLTHGRFTRALVGEQAPAPVLAWLSDRTTETRNYGETDREHLLRPEVEVVFGRDVRRSLPTARFVPFLQPEAATRAGGLHRRAPRRRERNGGALDRGCPTSCLPTHGRGPRPLRRRSTWLLLSPKRRSQARRRHDPSATNAITAPPMTG